VSPSGGAERSWFDRQKNVLDFTLQSLWRRRGRNASVILVYTLVVFLLGSVLFFTHSLRREAALLLEGAPELIVQRLVAGRHDLIPVSYAEAVKQLPGVAEVTGRLWGYYFDSATGANWTLLVPEGSNPAPGQVFLGAGAARTRALERGDRLALRSHDGRHLQFTVGGLFAAESELVSTDLVLVGASDFHELFGFASDAATDLSVRVRNPRELSTIAGKIQRQLPDTRVLLRDDILRTYEAVLDWRSGLLVVLFASSLLAFLILVWDKATGLSAEERREIGILKAVGWETADVLLLKTWEGGAVTLTAFLSGSILAYAHVFLASAPLFEPVLKGWSVLYPQFRPVPFVEPLQLTALFLLTVLPYTAATVVPAWRAATIDPDAVMRNAA
jgi:ABC-type lipoprotein release transport system permease subunit